MKSNSETEFLGRPSLSRVVSQTCTASQFSEDIYTRICTSFGQQPRFHRKQWEYVYILRVLEQFEMLSPHCTGIGFGCGKEPLAAVMAREGLHITITDIPPLDSSDSHWGATSAMDLFYEGVCAKETYMNSVSFRSVDMNKIQDDLGVFDFVWSCCAFEHLGSLQAGFDFVKKSAKCLKIGGISVHTTELNMSSDHETLESPGLSLYRRIDFLNLFNELLSEGFSVLPLNFYDGDLPEDKYIDLPPYKQETHLKLMIEKFSITSFGFAIMKLR